MRPRGGVILSLVVATILGGCEWFLESTDSGGEPPPRYAVTYQPNGAESGTVPVDGTEYAAGDTVSVLGNSGALTRAGYAFVGWNTEANGNGTAYTGGATFPMLASNVTLYATWEALFGSSIERVSIAGNGDEGNGNSRGADLSATGRYVVFGSSASNLVAGDTNLQSDIFVYDRQTDTTERVSVADDGTQGDNFTSFPKIDESGRHVVFYSPATTFLPAGAITNGGAQDIFSVDRDNNTIERVSVDDGGTESDGTSQFPDINGAGRYVPLLCHESGERRHERAW